MTITEEPRPAEDRDDEPPRASDAAASRRPFLSWKSAINSKGAFERKQSQFRNWVTADGSSGYRAERGRYHLYVSLACPWASRTLAVRKLKGLEDAVDYTVVDWLLEDGGWRFTDQRSRCRPDPLNHKPYLRDLYHMTKSDYDGSITVPVLFDSRTRAIVNNESSEIIRMLNSEFNAFCASKERQQLDLYPVDLRGRIDELNDWVYRYINNGVYRCGFAQTQEAYEEAFDALFEHLDKAEAILASNRYVAGERFTEADVRLFVTLIRFDAVYVLHFKANLKRIADYPNLQNYLKEIYQMEGLRETVDFEHIKHHYMASHRNINPLGIVAKGPLLDLDSPHDRARLKGRPLF